MGIKNIRTQLCLIGVIFCHLVANANELYRFERIELPSNVSTKINCILEDSKGLMWFGTNNGLVNYDAYRMMVVDNVLPNGWSGSFGVVNALAEDKQKQIWIGTSSGVYIYSVTRQTSKAIEDAQLLECNCRSIYVTSIGEVLVGTDNGMFIYNTNGTLVESYYHQDELNTGLSHNVVRAFYEDQKNCIWVGTYDGLNCLDRKNNQFSRYYLQKSDSLSHSNNLVLSISQLYQNSDSILLVGTETGLCVFNTKDHTFDQYTHDDKGNYLSNSVVKDVCVDGSRIWIGTDLGLNLFYPDEQRFENYFHNYLNTFSISNNVITQVHIDSKGNLWLATDHGINKMYLKGSNVFHNRFYSSSSTVKGVYYIKDIAEQENGDMWMCTSEGLIHYSLNRDRFRRFLPPQILHNKLSNICCDKDGRVWITTSGGLNVIDARSGEIHKATADADLKNALKNNYIDVITQSPSGNIWIGSHNKGVYKASIDKRDRIQFVNFQHDPNNENSLSSNSINDIVIDDKENVWIATSEGLDQIDVHRGVVRRYKLDEGNSYVINLRVDNNQMLWMTSNTGVYTTKLDSVSFNRLEFIKGYVSVLEVHDSVLYYIARNGLYYTDLRNEKVFRIPNADIGLKSVTGLKSISNDRLVVYGKEGFVTLNKADIKIEKKEPSIHWTNFNILNNEVKPFEKYGNRVVIEQHIDETDFLELKYSENTFSLEFSSLQYSHSEQSNFEYILEGYDKEWQTTKPGQAYVSYTQVRPGTFKLKVKASDKYGAFSDQARELTIKINPPLYLSMWAIVFYVVLLTGLFIISRRLLIAREKANSDIRFQTLQRQKSEELIEVKTRFFTNISHELKTPLTLISSPVDDLLAGEPDEPIKSALLLVKRNTDRLKKLVNQILDIRKIETGGEKLVVQEYDIIRFCDRVISQFKAEAERRKMLLQYNAEETSLMMWFDMEKMEKVIVNLISNALKFTPDGGCVRIEVKDGRRQLRKINEVLISISDDGCGISKKAQIDIFDRFNTQASPNYSNQHGTGIGLSLVKDYVTMHGGGVRVDSELDNGSCFTFSIPLDKYKFGQYTEEIDVQNDQEIAKESEVVIEKKEPSKNRVEENTQLIALVVEDDHDMRDYIVSGIKEQYKVIAAENGLEGFKKAQEEIPDIIISDWMMPQMNGIELCEKLKNDIKTCHIPVILLTAKGGLQSKTEGIETGVDDYIQKPFSMAYLLVRMKNLWQQRERLKSVYQKQTSLEPSEITVTSLDEKFLADLMQLLEKDMDNPELNVKGLSEKMGMSHTNLYRKIKALTGQTATEFVRTIRLKRAAQLLKAGQLNVSEVMYMVGFSHRSYFTQSFKAMYGVSPKEYK